MTESAPPKSNSGEDFYERFCALAEEARAFGHSVLIGLVESDPMNQTQEVMVSYTGGWVTCIGIAEHARHHILSGREDRK